MAVVLGFGSLSFIGFLYCALRIRSRKWWTIVAVVGVLTAIAWVFLLTMPVAEGEASGGGGYTAALWIGLIVYGFVVNRDYLNWRAQQVQRIAPRTQVSAPAVPSWEATPPPPAPGQAQGSAPPMLAPHRDEPARRGPSRPSRPPVDGTITQPETATGSEVGAEPANPPDAVGAGATRLTRRQARRAAGPRPRRPRKRWVWRRWAGFAPPSTIWEMADNCVKCGRALTNPRSRQARVGTKCIRIYGSQQRRIPNPQYALWLDRKTKAKVAYVAEKARADAEFARAKYAYDEARAQWNRF